MRETQAQRIEQDADVAPQASAGLHLHEAGALKFYFLTPVWGEAFTRRYVDVFLPAQLPHLAGFGNSVYRIITTVEDEAVIRSSEAFRKLSAIMEVQVLFGLEETYNNYRRMSHGYELGMADTPEDTPFIFLTPDSVWSLGSFDRVRELAAQGYRAVLTAGPRVNMEGFLQDFRAYPGGVNGRQLSALMENHLHKQFLSFIYGGNVHNTHPAALFWRVEGGFVIRYFVLHPILVRPKKRIKTVEKTLDYNLATAVKRSETYICTDSDEIMGVDVGLEDSWQNDIQPGPLTDKMVLKWFRNGWATGFHKWTGRHTIFIHSTDIGAGHRQAAQEAEEHIRRIYRMMLPLGLIYSPVETGSWLLRMAYRRLRSFLRRKLGFVHRKVMNFLRRKSLDFLRRESLGFLCRESLDGKWDITLPPGVPHAARSSVGTLRFYQMLIQFGRVKTVLELGTHAGASTLLLSEAMGAGGHITSVEPDAALYAIAQDNIARNIHGDRFTLKAASLHEALSDFAEAGNTFGLIVLNTAADCRGKLFEAMLACLNPGGMLLVDDIFMNGNATAADNGRGVRQLLEKSALTGDKDSRVILPIGNGLLLIYKH